MDARCSVVVMSCDSHADIAEVFIGMFRRFWPDCPFEVVLVAETNGDISGFDRVECPGRIGWGDRLAAVLGRLPSEYVLLLCDDYLLSAKIDSELMLGRLADAVKHDVMNLRLAVCASCVRYLVSHGDSGLMEYPKSALYCVATQPGYWNRESLLRIAGRTGDAWDFERTGSCIAADDRRPVLVTAKCEFPYVDSVRRGLWYRPAVRFCSKIGMPIDLKRRPVRPFYVDLIWLVRDWIYGISPRFFTWLSMRFNSREG